jgi:acetyl esterase/lipase
LAHGGTARRSARRPPPAGRLWSGSSSWWCPADADTTVTAAICLNAYYGQYYNQGLESAPLAHIGPDAPPFFIAHGDRDRLVRAADARRFADRLRRASANPARAPNENMSLH